MSHYATNWAIQQRGLKPATKIVLWHLCDRHNPDFGCFPSQELLAENAEMSRSALNDHLLILENAGLIRRLRSVNKRTGKRQRTRYILRFEKEWQQEPCPDSGHGEPETEEEHDGDPCPDSGQGSMSGFPADPCPDFAENHVRIPDNNPVREPLK
ncbi:helix-turn-helix domain-containing protein, partial [Thioclava sp. BHET1]